MKWIVSSTTEKKKEITKPVPEFQVEAKISFNMLKLGITSAASFRQSKVEPSGGREMCFFSVNHLFHTLHPGTLDQSPFSSLNIMEMLSYTRGSH